MARQTLRQFVGECLILDEKKELFGVTKCSGFALIHERGGSPHQLKVIKIGAKQWDPKDLAKLLMDVAENYAAGVPGVQQFQVLAFFDEQEEPQAFYPFRKSGDVDVNGGLGIMSEQPTTAGITQQLMRHLEANTRLSHQYGASLFGIMERTLTKQDDRIKHLEQEQHDVLELAKELIFQKAANEHQHKLEVIGAQQKASDRETLFRLLPAAVNRVTGKEIFPQSTVNESIIDQMAESLTKEQIQQMASILTPEQWGLMSDQLVEALKRKDKRDKAKADLEETDTDDEEEDDDSEEPEAAE